MPAKDTRDALADQARRLLENSRKKLRDSATKAKDAIVDKTEEGTALAKETGDPPADKANGAKERFAAAEQLYFSGTFPTECLWRLEREPMKQGERLPQCVNEQPTSSEGCTKQGPDLERREGTKLSTSPLADSMSDWSAFG